MKYIYDLGSIPQDKTNRVGGKARSLSHMLNDMNLNVPEGYVSSDDTGGWVKIDAYKTEGVPAANIGVNGNRVFGVGMTKDELEARQYWPIFDVITSANHNLYNDYGY